MTLSVDTPWSSDVSGEDSLVNYASNLAGPGDFPGFLGPVAGRSPGFSGAEASYLSDYDPDYDDAALAYMGGPGFLSEKLNVSGEQLVGALANAVLGAVVLPDVYGKMVDYYGPPTTGLILASAAIGGVMGFFFPVPTTIVYGGLLAKDLMGSSY